jgi:hypothetical protein
MVVIHKVVLLTHLSNSLVKPECAPGTLCIWTFPTLVLFSFSEVKSQFLRLSEAIQPRQQCRIAKPCGRIGVVPIRE